jgi:hypothetical protein
LESALRVRSAGKGHLSPRRLMVVSVMVGLWRNITALSYQSALA